MTLVQTEPKSIKIGSTAIKRVTIRPNGTEKQIRPAETVQAFDFQTDGALSWTGQTIYGTPTYTANQGWTIGTSNPGSYQSIITPPVSVYNGEKLLKRKLWMYRTGTATLDTSGGGFGTSNFTNGDGIWLQNDSSNYVAYIGDGNTNKRVQTTNELGEVTIEYRFDDDGHVYLSINGGTEYDLGSYAVHFRTMRLNNDLGICIGRWNAATPYIRKLEITTQP